MTVHTEKSNGHIPISFRLELDHAEELAKVAADNDRTLSAELRRAVRDYLAAQKAAA